VSGKFFIVTDGFRISRLCQSGKKSIQIVMKPHVNAVCFFKKNSALK